jgi:cytosine/adenosine deaminase-related metal-dependent hydrolase
MSTLLVRHAEVLGTMDEEHTEIPDGGLFIEDGFIRQVGPTDQLPSAADEVLDLAGHLVLPGLINTHHHFYQNLTRVVPAAQNSNLFEWLVTLYPPTSACRTCPFRMYNSFRPPIHLPGRVQTG